MFVGFRHHGGFDQAKALYCIINPAIFGTDKYWVDLFRNDPKAAEIEFSKPETLMALAKKYGVVVVDGAHRWLVSIHPFCVLLLATNPVY
jgi:hypothetical protein